MTEEEKKAIENLEELSHYCSLRAIDIEEENSNLWANFCVSIQKVENLIEKQQAEIQQLKYSIIKATKIIDEYANETEKDTKKLIEYQDKIKELEEN